ncbi:MAG: YheU family protein [Bdellovibrionales bacterium]
MNENQFIIEPEQLSKEALNGIIKEFILREGTDYGSSNYSLEEKANHVLKQLREKRIVILYDNELSSCNLMTRQELAKINS